MLAASHADSFGIALALMTGYVLGVVSPLCAVAVGIAQIRQVRAVLHRADRAVQLVSGAALLLLGALVGTGLWDRLSVSALAWLS